jgi:hypothetical protein
MDISLEAAHYSSPGRMWFFQGASFSFAASDWFCLYGLLASHDVTISPDEPVDSVRPLVVGRSS